MAFTHLHTHSHYSFLQGLGAPDKLAKTAKAHGMHALALTDAGNLHGAFEFYKACKKQEIKPIIGLEATISRLGRSSRDKSNDLYQIVLLAKNIEWYHRLIHMVTTSQLEGFVIDRPRIDMDLLRSCATDLIALSGNHMGEIAQHITTGKDDEFILSRIREYQEIFGRADYYLEVMQQGDISHQDHINTELIRLASTYNIPIVATHNVYYAQSDLAEAQDYLQAISSGRSIDDPDRPSKINGDHALLSEVAMRDIWIQHPALIDTTQEIVDKIDLDIPYGLTLIPKFPLSDEQKSAYEAFVSRSREGERILDTESWLLRSVCIRGMMERYDVVLSDEEFDICVRCKEIPPLEKKLKDIPVSELIDRAYEGFLDEKKDIFARLDPASLQVFERLEYELTVVDLMGFNGYFNIVSDYIQWAKRHDIPVGPGRWSAAGAVLAYVSRITDVEPIRYGLLFERFLNPARVSMPDIDVDFADDERQKVLDYVSAKYGSDHVAQVCTFGTMAAKAAFKDVGKAMGIPFAQMNTYAKLIPAKPGTTIESALSDAPEFRSLYDGDPQIKKVVDTAQTLEGTVRQLWVHACAVIIAPEPMTRYCPLQNPPKDPNGIVTQFSQKPLEDLGLLKMDFLGLRNLSIMKRALKIIRETHGVEIDLLKISFEDPQVFEVFAQGDTTGVFQFESSGMRKYLRELKPTVFEDIIAMVSLYRPGPLKYIPTFIARKHGIEVVKYPHPSLEAILSPTYGIAVYQEQIMALVQAFAGFSLAQADILRRAIGKKLLEVLMEQKQIFIDAAAKEGHPEELAVYIFDDIILPFADYGFNKSHAACYSMIAYQTAYLKAYYPTEFMTALMCSDEEDTERIRMEIEECRSKSIEVLPPDINESRKHFTFLWEGQIRFGLKALKGLGDNPIEDILAKRSEKLFDSVHDIVARCSGDVINKKSLEALIYSGSLDRFANRRTLIEALPQILSYHKEHEKKQATSQVGLFDFYDSEETRSHDFSLQQIPEYSYVDKMNAEIAVMGYPASGGPFRYLEDMIRSQMKWLELIDELKDASDKEEATHDELPSSVAQETPQKEEKKSSYREKLPPARLIGYVESVRKMPTKTGKMMGVALLSSVGFEFEMVVFPKDYDAYVGYLSEGKVLFIDGELKIDSENNRIQILPKKIISQDLSEFRSRNERLIAHEAAIKEKDRLDRGEGAYLIHVPVSATRDDLVKLKQYLSSCAPGETLVTLSIRWEIVSTKIKIADTSVLPAYLSELWPQQVFLS